MRRMTAITAGTAAALVLSFAVVSAKGGKNVVLAKKPSSSPGQQVHTAEWTSSAPEIDGILSPGEYSAAIPLNVKFNQRHTTPGILPGLLVPAGFMMADSNPADLSFKALIVYDDDNLYVAVDVSDDVLIDDGPGGPAHDDDVEIYVDGDNAGGDYTCGGCGSAEGFQLLTDVGGDDAQRADPGIDWESEPGFRPQGYVVEFRISLSSIDTEDGPGGIVPPGPGDTIGFNITVGDDDNGGLPYNDFGNDFTEPTDSYGAWDGDEANWNNKREEDWGSLYLSPPNGNAKRIASPQSPSSWAEIKMEGTK